MKRTTCLCWATVALLAPLACTGPEATGAPPRDGAVLATFVADVDAATGTLTIHTHRSPLATAALAELPWVQDGTPGSGPPDTVELVTEGTAGPVADGCAPGVTSYEAPVRLRSFFQTSVIKNAHVEITGMTATGFEGCGSAYPAPPPTTAAFGLFPYGSLTRAGAPGDSALATWRFRYPSATSFTMWGHVMADLTPSAAPPTVTSVSPTNGQTADTGSVTLTFSEPMAVSPTVAAISVTGPAGPVPGTIVPTGGGAVFTFTPAVPFQAGAHTVSVAASAADPLGATMAMPFSSSFTMNHELVSGTGSATLQPTALAFDRNGNGLATWTASPGSSTTLFSTYSAASGSWSEPAPLDANGATGVRVAASANQIAVLYSSAGIKVAIFTNGIRGDPTTLAAANYGNDWALASNGSGFAAVWSGTTNGTYYSVWNGVSWSAGSPTVSADVRVGNIALVAEGTGYRAVWVSTSARLHSATYNGTWSATTDLGACTTGIRAALAASATLTCIAWSDSGTYRVRAEMGGAVTTQGYATPAGVTAYSAAVIGDRCQVGMASPTGVYGAAFNGASWSASSVSLGFGSSPADAVAVSPLGSTAFLAAARVVSATSDVLVNRTTGWSFGGTASKVSTGSAAARYVVAAPVNVNGAVRLAWSQADAAADRIQTALVDGSGSGAPAILSSVVRPGSASKVRLASDSSGNALALWQQQHLNQTCLFWSYRTGGAWGAPQLLSVNAGAPVLASNGTDFMASWTAPDTATTSKILAQRFSGGGWVGSPMTVTSGNLMPNVVALVSDRTGYALLYGDYDGVASSPYATIYSGTWSTPRRLSYNTLAFWVFGAAGRPGEYLFAWLENYGARAAWASWGGSTWTWESIYIGPAMTQGVAAAAGPGGFAVVYFGQRSTSYVTAATIVTGGVAGPEVTLRSGGSSAAACEFLSVASNGSGYLVVSGCYTSGTNLQSIAYNGSAWLPARVLAWNTASRGVIAVSNGSGYSVLNNAFSSGGLYSIAVPNPISGAFGAPVTLGPSPGASEVGGLAGSSAGFRAAWTAADSLDPSLTRIFSAGL